ncbi:MAG: methionine gamma-lyase family protein [Saccharofermentanales bacterium]|nr:methionine gamma-lyase family protein [Bacillota bacterium]
MPNSDSYNIDHLYSQLYGISQQTLALSRQALDDIEDEFHSVGELSQRRQLRLIKGLQDAGLAESAFGNNTGYGYSDAGREQLERSFAAALDTEEAIVRLQFSSGTHVLATCLLGLLAPGDEVIFATGRPYDTLLDTLSYLRQRQVKVVELDLGADGSIDQEALLAGLSGRTRLVYFQKSRGYDLRETFLSQEIGRICMLVKRERPGIWTMVDNCYGEFTEEHEPTWYGADLIAGSLIKNPGAGIAPTGGYIAGRPDLLEMLSAAMTAPGVGRHIGPQLGFSRILLQGLYFAPLVVAEALKGAIHAARLFELAGYEVSPSATAARGDIVQVLKLGSEARLIAFCEAIQRAAPVDSFVKPIPAPMPGYDCDIIMASGSFIQGSSIELSADGPLRPPYAVFLQGALNFAGARLGVLMALDAVKKVGE